MKKNIISLLILIITIIAGVVFFAGCSKEDTLTPADFAPPTNFRALAQSNAVILYWTRSVDDGTSSFTGYRVMTFNGATKIDSFLTTNDTARITTGMVNGTSYKFKIWSVKSNGDVSIADSINWGPTERFFSIRIWEFKSSHPSGIEFLNGTAVSFKDSLPDNRGIIDLWIDGCTHPANMATATQLDPLLKSPSEYTSLKPSSTGWRTTLYCETSATSLDEQVDVPPAGSFTASSGLTIHSGRVYFAKTGDTPPHYVRFQVASPGVQGSWPERFIDLNIAYNSGTGPWAKQ